MVKKKIVVNIPNQPEARPVAMLVQVASQFKSHISIEQQNKTVNAKSIMGMMTLGLTTGQELVVLADGEDEQSALGKIEKFLCNK